MQKYRSTSVSLIVVIVSVLLATGLRLLLNPILDGGTPYITYFMAVAVSSWYGGFGPGILSLALSSIAALAVAVSPMNTFWPTTLADSLGLGLFWTVGTIIATLSEWVLQNAQLVLTERERFFTTLASIGDGVIVTDPQGRVEYLNSAAEALTDWTGQDAAGRLVQDVLSLSTPPTSNHTEADTQEAPSSSRSVNEIRQSILTTRTGKQRSIEESSAPLRNVKNEIVGIVHVFRDISARQKVDQALRASEARFRTLADSAPVLIWMSDANGEFHFFNKPWLDFTGRDFHQESGTGWLDGIHPDDLNHYLEKSRAAFSARSEFEMEYRLRRRDGEYRWVFNHGVPLFSENEFSGYIGSCMDITERKTAEFALRQSELRFRTITTNAPAAIFIKDLEGRYTLANKLACEVLGCPDGVEGMTDLELMPEDLALKIRERDREVISSMQTIKGEETTGWDGQTFLSVKFPWCDDNNNPIGICGVAVDITDRKRAEEAQRESDRQFQLLANSIPQLVWMARPDGYVFWFNQRCFEYTGATQEELEGWRWQKAIDPADRLRVHESWRAALASGSEWEDSFMIRRQDGEMRWHLARAFPLKDFRGNVVRWFGTNTDISERRHIESTLQFQADVSEALSALGDERSTLQKLARLCLPHMADWCVAHLLQEDGQLEEVALVHQDQELIELVQRYNQQHPPGWEDMLGIGEVLRTSQPELLTDVSTLARNQTLPNDYERIQLLDKLGLVSSICVPLRTHGRMYGVLTFVTAESGRKFGPSDLQVAEDLAHRATIALENSRLFDEVRDADRRKDEFLAMLSHELRNPLGPIRSGLDMLALNQPGDSETITFMQQQVDHLVRLVDDLLDVSRIIRGRIDLRRESVQFQSIITRAIHVMQPTLEAQQQQLSVSMPEEPLWLFADPVRLLQVVENLISNASKYSEPHSPITLTLRADGPHAVFSVRDQGIGMAPELLPRVFDLFTQSTRSLDRSQGGLGIGLTLVKRMIEMHGGSVKAESDGEGLGSEFTLQLPLSGPGVPASASAPVRQQRHQCRIMVVDDNQGNTRIISALLKKLGPHEIEVAHDGHQALEKVSQFRPELLLLDIGLPGLDGYGVGQQIREQPEFDSMLMVALTGYGQEEDRRRSRDIGFDEHLVKPVSLDQLKELLHHPKLTNGESSANSGADKP